MPSRDFTFGGFRRRSRNANAAALAAFEGSEAPDALPSNGQLGHRLFGYPRVGVGQLVEWTADWLERGGETLDRPTGFDVRDGKF